MIKNRGYNALGDPLCCGYYSQQGPVTLDARIVAPLNRKFNNTAP